MNHKIENWIIKKNAVESENGVVASQHRLAASAGAAMLSKGGNAVDAAVACAFALAAVEPWMCGLGGSGYMVVWVAAEKTAYVLDFQGMLPAAISPDDYPLDPSVPETIMGFPGVVDRQNVVGYRSITVPGAVKGLSHALARFGKFGLDSTLVPAIQLAERGLPCDWFTTLQIALASEDLKNDTIASQTYLHNGCPAQPEQYLSLGNLSQTLKNLANDGPDSFYNGSIGELICQDLQAGGCRIDQDDLRDYAVLEHAPLTANHRGTDLHTAGHTSGGPRLIETLEYIEANLSASTRPIPESWKIYADGLNKAWRSHKKRIGRATEVGGCTSHLSAVDREGNMVALTYSLLNRFGSCAVLPETGILMNNSVSYFDPRPGFPTTMSGRKRINASNMSPTIATRDHKAVFAIGASGANHIMPCTTQIAGLMLDFGMSLEEAFNHPRIDASDRGSIRVDPRMEDDIIAYLSKYYEVEVAQLMVFPKLYSCPSGVSRDPLSGLCHGINDPSQPIGGAVVPAPFVLENNFEYKDMRS